MLKKIPLVLLASVLLVSSLAAQHSIANTINDLDLASIKGSDVADIFLPKIQGWESSFAFRDTDVEWKLAQDAALAFTYTNFQKGAAKIWVGVQISKGKHVWEDSLIYAPQREGRQQVKVIEHKHLFILPDLKGVFFVYQRPNSTQTEAVLYWFENVRFKIGSGTEDRNVLISLWNYVESLQRYGMIEGKEHEEVEAFYLSFAKPIALHWQEIASKQKDQQDKIPDQILFALIASTIAAGITSILFRKQITTKLHRVAQ